MLALQRNVAEVSGRTPCDAVYAGGWPGNDAAAELARQTANPGTAERELQCAPRTQEASPRQPSVKCVCSKGSKLKSDVASFPNAASCRLQRTPQFATKVPTEAESHAKPCRTLGPFAVPLQEASVGPPSEDKVWLICTPATDAAGKVVETKPWEKPDVNACQQYFNFRAWEKGQGTSSVV